MKERLHRSVCSPAAPWFPSRSMYVFLLLWLGTGLTINLHDQRAFNLQQMGVDAIVTYGTFTLGHSRNPHLRPLGDTFESGKGLLPAKQPGQFATAALPYFLLSAAGITYDANYDLAASLVTWTSSALLAAVALTLLYLLLIEWGYGAGHAFAAVIAVGFGSHWLVFAGITHHDIIAASYLIAALYFSEMNLTRYRGRKAGMAIISGVFAGFVVFTSMLPALMVVAFWAYLFLGHAKKHIGYCAAGFLLGLAPLAAYNAYYFGSPFTQANIAGNYADTFFHFDYEQFMHHLNAYWGNGGLSVWKYSPVVVVGLPGLFMMPRTLRRVQIFCLLALALHMGYLLNIETLGTCQYGPRYLLPLMPLLAIGIPPVLKPAGAKAPFAAGAMYGVLLGYSLTVALLGAFGGAMQCDLSTFTAFKYAASLDRYTMQMYPLFWPMFLGLALLASLFINSVCVKKDARGAGTTVPPAKRA